MINPCLRMRIPFGYSTKLLALLICLVNGYCLLAQQQVLFSNKNIRYEGRVGMTDSCAELYWTGTNIQLNVTGTSVVKAELRDDVGNNYYYAIVDRGTPVKIKIDKERKLYTLAAGLSPGPHHIELFKVTNTDFITTRFFGFELSDGGSIERPDKKGKRSIEFFGNSITAGHGVDVPEGEEDSGAPEYFNNYLAYGALTARHFNAQYHCTSKSGIGITVSWFKQVMPDIYDRLNPANPTSKWNFKKYRPDIVVVNLFQNDSWLTNMPANEQFKARFGNTKPSPEFMVNAYATFIRSIRNKYRKATIICCLGNMDATMKGSVWPGYIENAVASLHDKKIVTHFFPYKNSGGHPKVNDQQAMANDLIQFIEGKYWK